MSAKQTPAKDGNIPFANSGIELQALIDLSRNRAEKARRLLAEQLAGFTMEGLDNFSDDERTILDDILVRLLELMEGRLRTALSEKLAESPNPPRRLIKMLAEDDSDIAGAVLRRSPALTDADLIDIADRRTSAHRIAIAERKAVSASVTAAVIRHGEVDVLETVLKNRTARISKASFRQIVAESERTPALQDLIIRRGDAPRALLSQMFWWVEANLRKRIIERFDGDLTFLKHKFAEGAEEALFELQADPIAAAAVNTIRDRWSNGGAHYDDLLVAIRSCRRDRIIEGLARLGGISASMAQRVLADPGGEGLAIVCKSAGVQKTQFVQLYLTLERYHGAVARPFTHIETVTQLYDRITWETAEFMSRYWVEGKNEKRMFAH